MNLLLLPPCPANSQSHRHTGQGKEELDPHSLKKSGSEGVGQGLVKAEDGNILGIPVGGEKLSDPSDHSGKHFQGNKDSAQEAETQAQHIGHPIYRCIGPGHRANEKGGRQSSQHNGKSIEKDQPPVGIIPEF